MNNKRIPFLVPIILFMMVLPAFSQLPTVSNAMAGGDEYQSGMSLFTPADSTIAIFPQDSLLANTFSGWYKRPGQMPIYIPAPLPNSMPVLNPPPVDEKMIIPIAGVAADSLNRPHQRK
ncbi:hypothetical protein [Rhodohalobacter sp. 8-1]|uniref:hypothetical protein n=1 Tax=Rhodohalobacter sp. 8-1 TaxID=3131972 RepID=UPI0030EF1583